MSQRASHVRVHQHQVGRLATLSERSGLPVPTLVEQLLEPALRQPPAWLTNLITDREGGTTEEDPTDAPTLTLVGGTRT